MLTYLAWKMFLLKKFYFTKIKGFKYYEGDVLIDQDYDIIIVIKCYVYGSNRFYKVEMLGIRQWFTFTEHSFFIIKLKKIGEAVCGN
jgi:hypothetical protein